MRLWDYEADAGMLKQTSGSSAIRIRLNTPIADKARNQATCAICVADLAHWMTSQAAAMAKPSTFGPESAINASFPGTRSDKLQLLNGWLSATGKDWCQAYRRARWYLRRHRDQTHISFEVRSELGGPFTLLVNGEVLTAVSLPSSAWKSLSVDLSGATAFVMEMQLEREPQEFSDGLFSVRRRRFGEPEIKRLTRAARAILPSTCRFGA